MVRPTHHAAVSSHTSTLAFIDLRSQRHARAALGLLCAALVGCAAWSAQAPERGFQARDRGCCTLLGIEEQQGSSDHNDDSVQLVASYRFDGAAKRDPQPVSLSFRVTRSRVNELRDHLQTHPAVICEPEGGPSAVPHVCVTPFDGQQGEPRP